MYDHGVRAGAAMRRRQRRLRSWWRHEQQSVAAALATAHHHSCDRKGKTKVVECERQEEAGSETFCAPRGPKTLPPGVRPAPPSEVAGPQVVAATGGCVAARAPLLAVSSLRGADGVDDTAVKYLLRAELKKKKEEEEEERKQELADGALDDKLEAEFDALMAIFPERLTSRQEARLRAIQQERLDLIEWRKRRRAARKSKKRRKKKTPRTSSSCCRAHRRQRQWYVHGWFSCGIALRAVFLPSAVRPKMLVTWAVSNQKDSYQWPVHGWLFGVRPWSTRLWIFLGDGFWMYSVFSSCWFNTGYIFTSVFWSLMVQTAETCGVSAVAVHLWSSTFPSCRRGSSSWSRLFSGSSRFCRCRSFFGGRCPCCAGRADSQVPPWRRPRFFFRRQAQMLGIMAGMAQRTVMPRHSCAWLVLLVMMQLALCSVRRLRRLLEEFTLFST